MTAEIAILNSNAVALAADSAVTIGMQKNKVYTSADKLFQMSNNAPVGIMFYGRASFLGVPWETVVKNYRSKLGSKTFSRLSDYSKDFIRFVKNSKQMFTHEEQQECIQAIFISFFRFLRSKFKEITTNEYDQNRKLNETQVKRLFADLVQKELQQTKNIPKLQGINTKIKNAIKTEYEQDIEPIRKGVFENLPMSPSTKRNLKDLVLELITSVRLREGQQDTGLVIAGFGEKEHFPKLVERVLFGIAAGHPLYLESGEASIDSGGEAILVPLAQKEMVITFMDGIDPDLSSQIEHSTKQIFDGLAKVIFENIKKKYPKYGTSLERKVKKNLDKLTSSLYNNWEKVRLNEYRNPVMEMVASLPKDELGSMAESLVNLTKFKRRISKQQETVGGPIDVAIITKGDGFVWTKRKHYFKPELNPRYISRITRG